MSFEDEYVKQKQVNAPCGNSTAHLGTIVQFDDKRTDPVRLSVDNEARKHDASAWDSYRDGGWHVPATRRSASVVPQQGATILRSSWIRGVKAKPSSGHPGSRSLQIQGIQAVPLLGQKKLAKLAE